MPNWKKLVTSGSSPVFNHITASGAIKANSIVGTLTGQASSVENNLTIGTGVNLNSGTTYNGSTAKTLTLALTEVIATDGANRVLTSDGDGTLTAEAALTVASQNIGLDGQVIINDSNNDTFLQVKGSSDDNLLRVNPQSEDRVGIGTANPTTKLQVQGDISASGFVSASSFSGDGSGLTNVSSTVDIDSLSSLGGTGIAQSDKLLFSDAGTEKSITFSNLEDAIFGNVSGDATIAAGGALTIAATSVENGMLAGSIANNKLANDGITIAGTDTSLGGSITADTIAGQISADTISGNQINGGTIGSTTITTLSSTNITATGIISGSTISGSFIGNGSGITDISATVSGDTFATDLKIGRDSTDLIDFASADNTIRFRVNNSDEMNLVSDSLKPHSNDGLALGASNRQWSDLFLAEGGVINFDNGDVTITQTGNILDIAGGDLSVTGNISASGDISSSGNLISNRRFNKTSNTDADHSGDIVYFGGTTSMDNGKIYHYKSDGTWELADADAVATCDGLLAVALGAASDTNGMLLRGTVTLDHDPGAVGDVLFVSTTAGQATATAPSGNQDIVRVVGYCLDASNGQIWFNPSSTFVEVSA